jgi:nucleotide-binding universal stress UspA family protein
MNQTIVIGYDGSDHARRALKRAADIAGDGGTLVVVGAHPFRDPRPSIDPTFRVEHPLEYDVPESELKDRDVVLAEAADSLKGRDLRTSYVLAMGDPANALLEAAEQRHADMIVIGAHGHSVPDKLAPGSVGSKLIARAPTDVLVVP